MDSINSGPTLVREVPEDLKRLVRIIIRGFYQHKEDAVVLDYILRNTIMNETELHEILKLDRKLLRVILSRLKMEHFLKDRLRIETGKDGKAIKQFYYYMNYKGFVNVVKYKLHQIQKRIESQERDDSCKASYKCSNESCSRTYTEFDIDKLADLSSIDAVTGEAKLICTYCGREVNEVEVKQHDTRQLLVKFNQQLEEIYKILRNIEFYTLSHEILEPNINNEDGTGSEMTGSGSGNAVGGDSITVDLGNPDGVVEPRAKEVPAWMTNTSIGYNNSSTNDFNGVTTSSSPVKNEPAPTEFIRKQGRPPNVKQTSVFDEDHIKKTLMNHENKTLSHFNQSAVVSGKQKSSQIAIGGGENVSALAEGGPQLERSPEESDTSESGSDSESRVIDNKHQMENDELMSSEEEDEDEVDLVPVKGVNMNFDDVTEEHISQMTSEEREIYAKVGQKRFSAFVD